MKTIETLLDKLMAQYCQHYQSGQATSLYLFHKPSTKKMPGDVVLVDAYAPTPEGYELSNTDAVPCNLTRGQFRYKAMEIVRRLPILAWGEE